MRVNKTVNKITNILSRIALSASVLLFAATLSAKEGIWIPATLKDREQDMKLTGLEIPVDQLYNTNGTGLNNAVVLFGRGCTAEVISDKGLILTNHHCGYGSVQRLSSTANDYFATGFWAPDRKGELPCPGLTVTFFRRMENVSDRILKDMPAGLTDHQHDSVLYVRIRQTEQEFERSTHLDTTIRPMYEGNQYWVFITQTYKDIRLVGFPPNGIGQFGGDDENWMWPRHTGDFSIFRIYAGADNQPADYAATNKPYETSTFFTINTGGYKEGDFTMVYGFPGTTMENISSYELKQIAQIQDPIAVAARTLKLNVWRKHMHRSRGVFLQYTSKYSGVANGWKKWQGEMEGLKATHALDAKRTFETDFQGWAETQDKDPIADDLLPQLETVTRDADSALFVEQTIRETVLGVELIQQAAALEKLFTYLRMGLPDAALHDSIAAVKPLFAGYVKNYDAATDKDVFIALMPTFFKNCKHCLPAYYRTMAAKYHHNYAAWAKAVFERSILADSQKMMAFDPKAADSVQLQNDPAWQLYKAINQLRQTYTQPKLNAYYAQKRTLNKQYLNAQMEMKAGQPSYPDANLTLRLAYGKVSGLTNGTPRAYRYQTWLKDVVALHDPKKDIFKVPQKLLDLYKAKDFGRWAVKGDVPVAFIATNHTTGGNSGSPTLNSKGQLIGTNFDRAYEGTMSDYYFSDTRCRNISVDIRYTLFIIEKFGGAGWLLDEMKIVDQ